MTQGIKDDLADLAAKNDLTIAALVASTAKGSVEVLVIGDSPLACILGERIGKLLSETMRKHADELNSLAMKHMKEMQNGN